MGAPAGAVVNGAKQRLPNPRKAPRFQYLDGQDGIAAGGRTQGRPAGCSGPGSSGNIRPVAAHPQQDEQTLSEVGARVEHAPHARMGSK